METFKTQIRIKPLRSCDKISSKYSLSKSIKHDTRVYDEPHIDNSKKNIILKNYEPENIEKKLEEIKKQFPMAKKNSTIDVANFIFTVNREFFKDQKTKEKFLIECKNFLIKENENNPDCVLGLIGHDDEDGFHVHAYCVPLTKTTQKNRFNSTEKICINYRKKYCHTNDEIIEAKKNHKQSELKTGLLQDRWAEFISNSFPMLIRGEKNSGKKHVTPKEYREKISTELPIINNEIIQKKETIKKLEDFKDNLSEELFEKNQQILSINNEIDKLEKKSKEKTEEIKMKENKIKQMNLEIYKNTQELNEQQKEFAKTARTVSIELIANFCGKQSYPTEVIKDGKKRYIKNAIDYLMYCENLPYNGCVKFIMDCFDEQTAKNEVIKKYIIDNKKSIEKADGLQEYNKVKIDIIKKQFKALGKPLVRITLQDNDREKKTINLGKNKLLDENNNPTIEKFYNVNEVINKIHQLNFYNANVNQKKNIFITPCEHEKPINFLHMFIDDVKGENVEKLKSIFGQPNLINESSPGNFQFVYNVPITEDEYQNNKRFRNKYINFFNEVNKIFGDAKISGLRHPFRLAGFLNTKPSRIDENGMGHFVKIIHADVNSTNIIKQLIHQNIEKYNVRPAVFKKTYLDINATHDFTLKTNTNNDQNELDQTPADPPRPAPMTRMKM